MATVLAGSCHMLTIPVAIGIDSVASNSLSMLSRSPLGEPPSQRAPNPSRSTSCATSGVVSPARLKIPNSPSSIVMSLPRIQTLELFPPKGVQGPRKEGRSKANRSNPCRCRRITLNSLSLFRLPSIRPPIGCAISASSRGLGLAEPPRDAFRSGDSSWFQQQSPHGSSANVCAT